MLMICKSKTKGMKTVKYCLIISGIMLMCSCGQQQQEKEKSSENEAFNIETPIYALPDYHNLSLPLEIFVENNQFYVRYFKNRKPLEKIQLKFDYLEEVEADGCYWFNEIINGEKAGSYGIYAGEIHYIDKKGETFVFYVDEPQENLLSFNTSKFHIRIDYLGREKYRYSSWAKDKSMNEDKPDLVIENGIQAYYKWRQTSDPQALYVFKNQEYTYNIDYHEIHEEYKSYLTVEKNGKEILSEEIIEILSEYNN